MFYQRSAIITFVINSVKNSFNSSVFIACILKVFSYNSRGTAHWMGNTKNTKIYTKISAYNSIFTFDFQWPDALILLAYMLPHSSPNTPDKFWPSRMNVRGGGVNISHLNVFYPYKIFIFWLFYLLTFFIFNILHFFCNVTSIGCIYGY